MSSVGTAIPQDRSSLHDSCTMGELLIRSIQRGGSRTAFISRGDACTYEAFGDRLSQFVAELKLRGVGRGGAVASLAGNTIEGYLVMAACYLVGARIACLHPMGSADDHTFIVQDCGADILVFDPVTQGDRALELDRRLKGSVSLLGLGPSAAPDLVASAARHAPTALQCEAAVDDVCWLVYTGGTTGRSKGVVHTHRTLVATMMAELAEWEWPSKPVFLATTPISHGAGPCIPPVLLRSGTVVLENGFTPAGFLELVRRHGVNATFLVPTMIYKLLDHLQGAPANVPSLELVIYGASPMSAARLREALDAFGPVFMQLYGQSEAPNCVTVLRRADHDPVRYPHRLASCGQAIASNHVALLDGQDKPVALGDTGEICVRGPLVMTGYWQRPAETRDALRSGWLRTGDLARQDAQGYLYIVGRSKDMIITGGFNVYPAEIEEALCALPSVSAAAVIGVPDPVWGEAVTAVIALRPGQHADCADLIRHVRESKGPICAPKRVEFVESIPVTSLGKPDKKLLRQRYATATQELNA